MKIKINQICRPIPQYKPEWYMCIGYIRLPGMNTLILKEHDFNSINKRSINQLFYQL